MIAIDQILDELNVRDLLQEVTMIAKRYHVTLEEIFGPSHEPVIVAARHEFWTFLRGLGWSYPAIARLARRDHTTVMSAMKKNRTVVKAEPATQESDVA